MISLMINKYFISSYAAAIQPTMLHISFTYFLKLFIVFQLVQVDGLDLTVCSSVPRAVRIVHAIKRQDTVWMDVAMIG